MVVASAFVDTNPTDELITSGLLVTRRVGSRMQPSDTVAMSEEPFASEVCLSNSQFSERPL